ncbi:MAG TPA: NapC/NirT family cytochrome c [Gammaproteobacteria bacterium]|nr:NapC/NirT family cytochrome c [Gammaproteobacteria bacterium]
MARHFFASLTRSPISLAGTALAVAALTLMIFLFIVQVVGFEGGPYLGILTFLVLPVFFVTGLLLIPVGILRQRKKLAKSAAEGEKPSLFPVIDLNQETTRKSVIIFMVLTLVNIIVLAGATYKGVAVMETNAFCGLACHSVMQPEHTAHQRSPHSRVHCVDCHIGPGADWFVKSKLDGAWQMVAVTLDIYPRPIETPLHELRPARDTCEQCHWPTKFVGDKLKIETVYDEDENNTELKNAILLKVGGLEGRASSGIHWHVNPDIEIRYRSDHERMDIYDIEMIAADGTTKTFVVDDAPEDQGEWRTMDCVDCHNRPTHIYRTPGEELDRMLANNKVSTELPYIRREGARIVEEADYESHEAGREGIATSLRAFYRDNYPEVAVEQSAAIETAADALGDIYSWNVFPHMNVRWDTYPDHSGHPPIRSRENAPGCFRCHNRDHKTAEGERISRSCNLCHTVLATREENPEILEQLNP